MLSIPGLRTLRAARALGHDIRARLDGIQEALGRLEARQAKDVAPGAFEEAEFKVSSQWGEDGIIEHLVRHVPIPNRIFVEFGVESYAEANTRFLLRHRNWSGLVMDGSESYVAAIRRDPLYWRHNLKAVAAFITRDNINDLISSQGVGGDIGLLSVDIDGNDYWVWEAISCITPRIVIAEYNAQFGPNATVSIPYDPGFQRSKAHHSNLYWGCSLAALEFLARKKGYVPVGCNLNGNNAFFVRRDVQGPLPERPASIAFRPAKYRESRGPDGALNYLTGPEALAQIASLPLVDVTSGNLITVGDTSR